MIEIKWCFFVTTNSKVISNKCYDFFVNVGPSRTNKIPHQIIPPVAPFTNMV